MPAKHTYHDQVKRALTKDGWTITHDPLRLEWGLKDMYVDLGAEQLLAAEKAQRKIAVEIKSFVGLSEMNDLEHAVGQYVLYHDVPAKVQPEREPYLAINETTYADLFSEAIGILLLENRHVRLLVFDPEEEVIDLWTP